MKKAAILFCIFFVLDVVLFLVLSRENHSTYTYAFLPAIFLEISIYGSIIIYDIEKKNKNKDEEDK